MRLGIIGGLGPMATAYFMELLINMTDAKCDQDHLEMIIYNCPSIPDRTAYILGKSNANPVVPIIKIGKKLKEQNVDCISIPCITAHYFHDEIEEKTGCKVIHAIRDTSYMLKEAGLTLGYYNNFEKTSEVFVQNPLNSRYPELIYKTGDLGKRNERGELIFVSRKDYQIKHMGHRIELGEIEVNVNMIEEISTSCAVYDKEKGKIVLYYIGELEPDKLVRILKDKLPRYMIPNKTEKLEQMPLTANGKIDRVFLMKKAQER